MTASLFSTLAPIPARTVILYVDILFPSSFTVIFLPATGDFGKTINTGTSDIDSVATSVTQTTTENIDYNRDGIVDATITSVKTNKRTDNDQIEEDSRPLIDFTEVDPFSENKY